MLKKVKCIPKTSGITLAEETSVFWALELNISKLEQPSCASSRTAAWQQTAHGKWDHSEQRGQVCAPAQPRTHASREGQREDYLCLENHHETIDEMVKKLGYIRYVI